MLKKSIENIVFYKTLTGEKKATVFYKDGFVKNISFEEGIDACEEIVKENNIQTKDAFKEMINRKVVHVVPLSTLTATFDKYFPKDTKKEEVRKDIKEAIDEEIYKFDDDEEIKDTKETKKVVETAAPVLGAAAVASTTNAKEEDIYHFDDEDEFDGSRDFDNEVADAKMEQVEEIEVEDEEKEGFFKKSWRKIKKSKLIKGLLIGATALAVLWGVNSCSKKTMEGEIYRSNLPGITNTLDKNKDTSTVSLTEDAILKSRFYNNATINGLLKRTTNQTQKTAMTNAGTAMDGFNNTFAHYYLEDGKDVRPSLKFDEVVALQTAYNDYSKDELRAIFNGADVRSEDLQRAYKDASLQLMGAHAIENSKHPVDMSMLIESKEGKEFYKKYHDAFLAAKEATNKDEKIKLVKEFYAMVHQDFPISKEVRTEGISHAENYEQLEAYKLSVTPMIAAAETMWQNLEVDNTLNDMEIDFLNDLGLCNYADKTFERAELIALSSTTDAKNPKYEEYKNAFEKYYRSLGIYYIDDAHRELTKLQSFQDAVNWHFAIDGVDEKNSGSSKSSTSTKTETKTWKKTTTTYSEKVEKKNKKITDKAKAEVDAQIEKENEQAKKEAEAAAEKERQRIQAEEDKKAQEIENQVKQDEKDLQDKINQANDKINNGGTVNENDIGHGTQFDDNHSDSNGNLDNSVTNITTDPTGDKTNEPLPDPNETGKRFDAAGEKQNTSAAPVQESPKTSSPAPEVQQAPTQSAPVQAEEPKFESKQSVESTKVADDYYFEDAWIEFEEDSNTNEEGYQYTR
ncbi:MAG: hypothetical protein IKQ06_02810 [Bacilli bacterium]|nr:hypothetical protein [Bacilli bacterium]